MRFFNKLYACNIFACSVYIELAKIGIVDGKNPAKNGF